MKNTLKKIAMGTLLLGVFFIYSNQAHAAVIYDTITGKTLDAYNVGSTYLSLGGFGTPYGTTIGQLTTIQAFLGGNVGGFITLATTGSVTFLDCTGSFPNIGSGTLIAITLTGTQCNLSNGIGYQILFSEIGATNNWLRGSNLFGGRSTDNYNMGRIYTDNTPILPTTYFNTFTIATTTGTISTTGYWNTGDTLFVQQNTNLTLDENLYGSPVYATSTGSFNFTFPYVDSSISIGSTTTTYTLTPTIVFKGRLMTGTTTDDATSTSLTSTATTTVQGGLNNPFTYGTTGTSTLPDITNFLSFINVPNLLQTRVPFAYLFQIADGITEGINSSSTDTIPSGTFTYKNTIGGTSTIDMFSPATIEYYFTPTLITLWRGLLVAILYVGFGYTIYHMAKSKHII